MTNSVKHSLPYISVGQSQKEVTHNEALAILDILLAGVCSSIETGPPATSDGLVVLVAASSTTGAFVGKENKIAYYLTSAAAWAYSTPVTGQTINVTSTNTTYRYSGSAWVAQSGTYTPTLTNVTNINASTAYPVQWMRVGNVVNLSGKARFNATAAGAAELGISLPPAATSNFANNYEAAGTASSDNVLDGPMWIEADVTNDRLSLKSTQNGTTNHDHFFHATYQVN